MKIKEVRKNVKEHLKYSVKDRFAQVGIKTKDKAVNKAADTIQKAASPTGNNKQASETPEGYASEKITDSAKRITETAGAVSKKILSKGYSKAKKKISEKRDEKKARTASEQTDNPVEPSEPMPDEKKPDFSVDAAKTDAASKEGKGNTPVPDGEPTEKSVKEKTEIKRGKAQNAPETKCEELIQKVDLSEKHEPTPALPVEKKEQSATVNAPLKDEKMPERTVRTRARFAPKSKEHSAPDNGTLTQKTVKHYRSETERTIRTSNRSAEIGKRTIKTADSTFKATEKGTQAAKDTAETTVKTAKRTVKTSEKISETVTEGAQAIIKALAELGKTAAAGVKSAGALAAGGGSVTVLIIIICVLIAAIAGTFIGIFLTNDETTGSEITMDMALSQLTTDYFASLTDFEADYTYDTIEVKGDMSIDWKEVIAVYAVQSTNGKEGAFEVATLNADKVNVMKTILLDMCSFTGNVTTFPEVSATISTDSNGNSVVRYTTVNKQKLTVTVTKKTPMQYAQDKGFSAEAKAQLEELLGGKYDELWDELLAGVVIVLQTNSTWKPTSIFTWPLSVSGTVTSRFGTRVDPITGEIKTHGGTDIAAPTGTPILAAADGVVEYAGYNEGGYGFYVRIRHNAVYETLYGHCSVLHVTTGQTVKQGQKIAEVGSTGRSTGPHCHFEVIQNGVRIDALRFYN